MRKLFLLSILAVTLSVYAQSEPWQVAPRRISFEQQQEECDETAAPNGIRHLQAAPRHLPAPRTLTPRVLVIMANFADWQFVMPQADADSMFNAVNWTKDGATGSVRQYFHDQSSGQYNPQFDIVGPVTLSQNYAYYGYGKGTTAKPGYMVTEACALVDDSVDFSLYDGNNDGYVDMVFVLFAGFGENDPPATSLVPTPSNLIWPHYWNINSAGCGTNTRIFDGKTVDAYECANELDGYYSTAGNPVVAGIGILVHEYCHGLGIPDLYSTTTSLLHKTLAKWSVLDYGPYNNDMHTPPCLTAYERWYMGWLTPKKLTGTENVTLLPLSEGNEACYFTEDGRSISNILDPDTSVFYILENRQQTGWDLDVPGNGLLLYKIHYSASKWSSNRVNNDSTDMGVDILEADGLTPNKKTNGGYFGKAGDAYPYQGKDSIVGINTGLPIRDITINANRTISFKVAGGYECFDVAVQTNCNLGTFTASLTKAGLECYDASEGYYGKLELREGYAFDSIQVMQGTTMLVADEDYIWDNGELLIGSITDETTILLYGHEIDTTPIDNIHQQNNIQKIVRDGQVYIIRQGIIYTVLGNPISL